MRSTLLFLALSALLFSCTEAQLEDLIPKSSYNAPFPKRGKNLRWKLGDEFALGYERDTVSYQVFFNRRERENVIIEKESRDTVFIGRVSKYRGLYYFSQKLDDRSYWIHAVKFEKDGMRGFQTGWIQMLALDDELKRTNFNSRFIQSLDTGKHAIRLQPDRTFIDRFYTSIIDSLPLVYFVELNPTEPMTPVENSEFADEMVTEPDERKFFLQLYPNPAETNVQVVLTKADDLTFGITDLSGKMVLEGVIKERISTIDVSMLKPGVYIVHLYAGKGQELESVKLVKK